jgi:polysaccharide pyruvyl transferase WcaK-like protein
LEEIPALELMLKIFAEANRRRKARIIFGCGVGPLHTEGLRKIVGEILRLSTAGFVRDEESRRLARELGGNDRLGVACDPALAYLTRWRATSQPALEPRSDRTIVALLRANTSEYINDLTARELQDANTRTAGQLAGVLARGSAALTAKISLLPMHSLWVGGDDRIFNRLVARELSHPESACVERRYLTLDQLLRGIQGGDVAVAMRYHGHLFCMALGIPFLSIDYTGKNGKVGSLLRRMSYAQWSEDWRTIDERRAASRIQQLFEDRAHWSDYLLAQTAELTTGLEETYASVFPE